MLDKAPGNGRPRGPASSPDRRHPLHHPHVHR